jgi:plasmid maintenance system antidote protein VapI
MAERRRDQVREAYESLGIDRHEVARRAGVSAKTITNAISGQVISKPVAARIGLVIGWTADDVLRGERILEREDDDRRSDHVSPQPLDPPRRDENDRPPNKPDSGQARGAA